MALVEQKLQPTGQPTEGMSVAATLAGLLAEGDAHGAGARCPRGCGGGGWGASSRSPRKRLSQRTPSPRTMWSASTFSGRVGMLAMWPPMRMVALGWCSRMSLHMAWTLPTLGMIAVMPMMSYWVRADLFDEAIEYGEVQDGAGRGDVGLEEHQPPGAVEHAQGERALRARDLVVVQLHRVDASAAERIVLGVGPKDTGQQHPCLVAQGMRWAIGGLRGVDGLRGHVGQAVIDRVAGRRFEFVSRVARFRRGVFIEGG